jgi:hypothetical protein
MIAISELNHVAEPEITRGGALSRGPDWRDPRLRPPRSKIQTDPTPELPSLRCLDTQDWMQTWLVYRRVSASVNFSFLFSIRKRA